MAYLDLYSGKGEHENGEISTGIKVLQTASNDYYLRKNLVAILNDVKKAHCSDMERVIKKMGIDNILTNKPIILNEEVNDLLAKHLGDIRLIPTLCFIDPYGFKGLSIALIKAVMKDWGCDCIVFFHSSGINRNLRNEKCISDMEALFGKEEYSNLLKRLSVGQRRREKEILNAFIKAARKIGAKYELHLQFNFPYSKKISHHLVFLSKHHRGFDLIKEVMSKESIKVDGISQYVYIESGEVSAEQLGLNVVGPMGELKEKLLARFRNSRCKIVDLIETCHKEAWKYTEKNIKDALKLIEKESVNKIVVVPPQGKKRKPGTMGDNNTIIFNEF